MAKWLEQASQWHELYCHDLKVISSNPSWVELGVRGTSVLSRTWTKNIILVSIVSHVCILWFEQWRGKHIAGN